MQIRPLFIGLAVAVAAAGFLMAVTITLVVQPSHRGTVPSVQQRTAQR